MFVTLFGIVTLVRPIQLSKAYSSMLVTLFGIVTFIKPPQSLNAAFPMLVTPSRITTFKNNHVRNGLICERKNR